MRTAILCFTAVLFSMSAAVSLSASSALLSYRESAALANGQSGGICAARGPIGLKTINSHGRSVGKAFYRPETCGDRMQGLAMLACFGLFGVVRAVCRYDHLEKR